MDPDSPEENKIAVLSFEDFQEVWFYDTNLLNIFYKKEYCLKIKICENCNHRMSLLMI